MVHFVSRHGTLRSTPGNFRQVTEKNRLYSVFFDFAVECGQSDFEQAGCFGLITFVYSSTRAMWRRSMQKVQNCREWFHQIVRNGCSVYRAASRNIQPFTLANNQTALYHITQFPDITFPGLLFEGFEKSGCYFRNGTCQPSGEVLYKAFARIRTSPARSRKGGR